MENMEEYRARYRTWKEAQKPKCGARTRTGKPCIMRPLINGRCRFHGGMSTGARTQAGRDAISQAQVKRWEQWRKERTANG